MTKELAKALDTIARPDFGKTSPSNDTVACISDAELLRRAVRECRRGRGRAKGPLWSKVADRFALGSTFASQLCRRFDLDPDEAVRDR